jgi:hypothetical protein
MIKRDSRDADDPRLLLEWMCALALSVTKRILTATVNRPPRRLFSGGNDA